MAIKRIQCTTARITTTSVCVCVRVNVDGDEE